MSGSSFVGVAMLLYVGASLMYAAFAITGGKKARFAAKAVACAALVVHSAAVTSRVMEAARLPLSNTYETLLVFSWILTILTFWIQSRYEVHILGAFTFPLAFVALAAASLPQISSEIEPLVPALKSNWLLIHVLTCFVAYAAFGVAFATSAAHVLNRALPAKARRVLTTDLLDSLTYRAITLGFPFLTVGIVTGAVWANLCWGRYWGFDPKETWSLITWIVYCACLHLRYSAGLKGRWAAWLSIAGFISVFFTYLGVNYLLPSLHGYA